MASSISRGSERSFQVIPKVNGEKVYTDLIPRKDLEEKVQAAISFLQGMYDRHSGVPKKYSVTVIGLSNRGISQQEIIHDLVAVNGKLCDLESDWIMILRE